MRIESIRVEDRHRNDLGDLSGLAASIGRLGLLHPVVVTDGGRLIAGHRRLEACRSLGMTDVPVTYARELDDALGLLQAERDENLCRKDMAVSEKVALGLRLEELEAPKAEERRREHGGTAPGRNTPYRSIGSVTGVEGEVAAIVGNELGLGRTRYYQAKRMIKAAGEGDETAAEAIAEMDRTGKVTTAHDKWHKHRANGTAGDAAVDTNEVASLDRSPEARQQRAERIKKLAGEAYTSRQIAPIMGLHPGTVQKICRDLGIEVPADKSISGTRHLDSNRIAEQTVTALEGLVAGIGLIDYDALDRGEVPHWVISLTNSLRLLNRFTKQIREMT